MGSTTGSRGMSRGALAAIAIAGLVVSACGHAERTAQPVSSRPRPDLERALPAGSSTAPKESGQPSSAAPSLGTCPAPHPCEALASSSSQPQERFDRLSKEVVRRALRREVNRMRGCFEQHLDGCGGRWHVRFVVRPAGWVEQAGVVDFDPFGSDAETNPRFEQCIEDAFCGVCFPRTPGGNVTVTYPLHVDCAEGSK